MYHELVELNEQAIYADVDVLMKQPFDISGCDVLVWSPEPRNIIKDKQGNIDWTKTIYISWEFLSQPEGYDMPEYIQNTDDAYNCGVLWFRNKEIFLEWRKQYYAFCINNPCKLSGLEGTLFDLEETPTRKALFPCNAEQRILKAVLTHYKQTVRTIMATKDKGLCKAGYHFFWFRANWQFLNTRPELVIKESLMVLNGAIFECLTFLKNGNKDVYTFFSNLEWLKGFELKYIILKDHIVIRKYI